MKRGLTSREIVLLCILAVVAVVCGYIMLFYIPMTEELENLQADTEMYEIQLVVAKDILSHTNSYSLNFSTADTTEKVVRRSISMSFTCGSYTDAKNVLQQLHDCRYRCMIDNLNFSLGRDEDSNVTMNTTIVFFEMQP